MVRKRAKATKSTIKVCPVDRINLDESSMISYLLVVSISMYICVYIYTCVYIYICIYKKVDLGGGARHISNYPNALQII